MLRGNEHHRLKNSGQRTWGGSKARDKIASQQSIGRKRVLAARGASLHMGGWVAWHDSETVASMGLVALAEGGPESDPRAKAAARAEAEALHAAVVARLTSLYGPNGLWARNKTREQDSLRVLQLLHMDNRMNILQAMQESSPEVRGVWRVSSHQHAVLVHPWPKSFARTLPVISGAKRRAVNMPPEEAGMKRPVSPGKKAWQKRPHAHACARRRALRARRPAVGGGELCTAVHPPLYIF